MGASSSSAAGLSAKERRKSTEEGGTALLDADKRARRLLLQNGLLRRKSKAGGGTKAAEEVPSETNASSWQKKAYSMYDLQQMRGKSVDAEAEEAAGQQRDDAAGEETKKPRNVTGNAKKHRLSKISTSLSKSPVEQAPPLTTKSVSADLPSPSPPAGGSSPQQESAPRRSPAGQPTPAATTNASGQSQPATKTTQRRRPLTWAWIRGHEVNLPAGPTQPQPAPPPPAAVERRAKSRRRSLRTVESRLSGDAPGGCQRQNSANANSAECSANGGPPLGRRCSQANAGSIGQSNGGGSTGGRQKNRRSDAGFAANANLSPISANAREIIQFCFDNPHNEIGSRICSRLLEKRPDFRQFAYSMGKERWQQMTGKLKEFLELVVRKVDNIEMVERLSRKYGEEHVELKCFGFKPDFWVSLADAMTVECVILDQATHQPSDTITAWSLLVSIMFSAVRDGYYQALRAARISQRHRNVQHRENSFSLATQTAAGSPGVEKSASANELQSPKRKTSGSNKYQNHLEQKSVMPNDIGGATGIIVEEMSIPVQFF
uniref:GLOBIN domain-containing protein n=1 Tax=Globodera pallida TaxID=36090 RepID=A0A183BPS7_GLOPA